MSNAAIALASSLLIEHRLQVRASAEGDGAESISVSDLLDSLEALDVGLSDLISALVLLSFVAADSSETKEGTIVVVDSLLGALLSLSSRQAGVRLDERGANFGHIKIR